MTYASHCVAERTPPAFRKERPGKCVLLICFHFPPSPYMGAVRPAGLAKYLAEFGWDTVVLTTRVNGDRRRSPEVVEPDVVETEYRDALSEWKARLHLDGERSFHQQLGLPLPVQHREAMLHSRVIDVAGKLLAYPDRSKGWVRFASAAVAEIARRRRIDAIISSAPPFSVHMIAAQAKRMLGCPWIADYRDLWNIDEQTLAEATGFVATLRRHTERRLLANADALVTVSERWSARLHGRFPASHVTTISNGFDEELFCATATRLTSTFSITHTGQLYEGRRDPAEFLEAVQELIGDGALSRQDVCVRFFGPIEGFLPGLISRLGLEGVVEIHSPVSREQSLQKQRESQLLLLLPWGNPLETGVLTGKVYEYLASSRPVIAVGGGRGAITELLDATRGGTHAVSKADVKAFLRDAYAQFRAVGQVPYRGRPEVVKKFTHREMAAQFAQLLNATSAAKASAHDR
jgi:glycosyltransferase involved in cell wall biosynthesis